MKNISNKYRKLSEKHKNEIAEKILFLKNLAIRVEEKILPKEFEIDVCPFILENVVISYFYDRERHNDFHGSDNPNSFKKAAFYCKWISKLKPFRVDVRDNLENKYNIDEKIFEYKLLINEIYCIALFCAITKEKSENFFDEKLIYELHYGNATANMLMVVFDRKTLR